MNVAECHFCTKPFEIGKDTEDDANTVEIVGDVLVTLFETMDSITIGPEQAQKAITTTRQVFSCGQCYENAETRGNVNP